jgi:hypothetical protein
VLTPVAFVRRIAQGDGPFGFERPFHHALCQTL